MKSLRLALDWTPNVNHIGLFVAKELGFYQEVGIDLTLVSPQDDNYQTTPGKKLELRTVDMAIAPFETVISLQNKENKVDALAIYALLQEDISSIATLTITGIRRPKDLDGKLYASYKARYEDHIVQQLIKNDGGKGEMKITYPEKLGIWNTLLEGNADATWIFDNWEGVEAQHKGITELHVVTDMHVRKKMMYELCDAAVILSGGYGTLDELFEMLTWNTLKIHSKKIFLVNSNGFYDHLIAHIRHMYKEDFLYETLEDRIVVVTEPSAIFTSAAV